MTKPVWDPKVAANAAMADHCMKLGAVILKPASKPQAGFAPPREPVDDPS